MRRIGNLRSVDIRAEHHREVEVTLLRLQCIFRNEVGYLVYVIWLVTHEIIDGSILMCPQISHYSLKSCIFVVCHFDICG